MSPSCGKVFLVGAGPGDPGLLTLRGAECIREADVILHDYLASPELLYHSRPGCQLICLGRHGHGRLMTQAEINAAMVKHAKAGRLVVRLKGGDPTIFARLADELAVLESEGIAYEIVPGVTAAQAASGYSGIPLTQRDDASCVAFVTGHECDKATPALDYPALAAFPGTLVFYMGVTTARDWSRELIDHGKPADTAVAIARRCSLPDQETFFTTLGELTEFVKMKKLRPPAIIIVGEVARQRPASSWFTSQPLFGTSVLVTRPAHQSPSMRPQLQRLGAEVLMQPAIEIREPGDWTAVDDVLTRLPDFDWLVFSSANGVQFFFDRLFAQGYDVRQLAHVKIAAIGPATSSSLAERGLIADVQPEAYRAEALAAALKSHSKGKRFFLARASRGRDILADMLTSFGAAVEQAVVYESADVLQADQEILDLLISGKIDWVTVTSPAIGRALIQMFGENLRRTRLAAISPLTAEALEASGFSAAAIANVYTTDGLIDAILNAK